MSKRVIVWFRNDLRLHDNEALTDALHSSDEVLPVYVFDKRIFEGKTRFGFDKTAKYRAKFIRESVIDLKSRLQDMGSDLCIRYGKPEEEIFAVANEAKSSYVYCNRERTQEEVDVQDSLEYNLWTIGQEIRYSRGKMLYYTADLPFPVNHTPDIFNQFRKEVERFVDIREPLSTPYVSFPRLTCEVDFGVVPMLEELGHKEFGANNKGGYEWKGGETEALKQLKYFIWDTDLIKDFKTTKSELLGRDFSSKFSPWLAHGCISPKHIFHELKRYEVERSESKSTYWMFYELMQRDYLRLMGKKYGNDIFKIQGPKRVEDIANCQDMAKFRKWATGMTGIPFIDANMRELNQTGYMSSKGRYMVADFLCHELKLDWRMGAEYFESMLLDYDPCSNYGNWNHIAGVDKNHKVERHYNIISQAKQYDGCGKYVKYWLPELQSMEQENVHTPSQVSELELMKCGVELGKTYPKATVQLG